MDLSKLNSNEKLAGLGAALTIIGSAIAAGAYRTWGPAWLGVLAGAAMLLIVLLPVFSPEAKLPGSKGTLMLLVGGIGGAWMILMLLLTIGFTFTDFDVFSVLFLIAVAGAVVMAWAGWQEFQAEGGKFRVGSTGDPSATTGAAAGTTAAAVSTAPPAEAPAVPPPAATPPAATPPAATPPAATPPAAAPSSDSGMSSPPPTDSGSSGGSGDGGSSV